MTVVGAALVAVALFDTPARAQTGGAEHGARTTGAVDQVVRLLAPEREAAVAPSVRRGASAPGPSDVNPDRSPRPATLVPRIVERVLPSRPAPPPPADAPTRPPTPVPDLPAAPVVPAPPSVDTASRPAPPVVPPRTAPPGGSGPADPVGDAPAGSVGAPTGPATRPAAGPSSGAAPLVPRLAHLVDTTAHPLLDVLADLPGGVLRPVLTLPGDVLVPLLPPVLGLPGDVLAPLLPPGPGVPAAPLPDPVDEPEQPLDGGPVVNPSPATGHRTPPVVHNGGMWDAVGGGWVRAPVDAPAGPDCRSPSRPSDERPANRPGVPSQLPGAPGDDRVTGDSGPRGAAALPARLSDPDRVLRHSRPEPAPVLATGLYPTVAGRPG